MSPVDWRYRVTSCINLPIFFSFFFRLYHFFLFSPIFVVFYQARYIYINIYLCRFIFISICRWMLELIHCTLHVSMATLPEKQCCDLWQSILLREPELWFKIASDIYIIYICMNNNKMCIKRAFTKTISSEAISIYRKSHFR